jgi:hypothetical protein
MIILTVIQHNNHMFLDHSSKTQMIAKFTPEHHENARSKYPYMGIHSGIS